jgi:hypothetical protein
MRLARSGDLSMRIAYHLLPQTAGNELRDLAQWAGTMQIGDGDEWLRVNGAGEALTLSTGGLRELLRTTGPSCPALP